MESSMIGLPEKEKSPHRQVKHGVTQHPTSQERGRPSSSGESKKAPRPVSASASPRSRPKPVSKTVDTVDSSGVRPRPVPRPSAPLINGDDGRIWLKAALNDNSKNEKEKLNKELASYEIEKQDGEKKPEPMKPVKEELIDGMDHRIVPSPQKFEPQSQEEDKITGGFTEKPSTAEAPHDAREMAPTSRNGEKEPIRPNSLPAVNGLANGKDTDSPSPLPELTHGGHVPLTRVKSPEEMTGVKSPDPESWTVPLETGPGLEWMNGQTPTDGGRATSPPMLISSLRSARELPSRPEAMMAEKQQTSQPEVMTAEKHPVTQPEVMYAEKHAATQPETMHTDNLPTTWSEMPSQSDLLKDQKELNTLPDSVMDHKKTPGSEMLPVQKEVPRTDSGKHKQPQTADDVPAVQIVSPSSGRSLASDVLGRARSKFDQFWSKNK
ncbi:microtubule-associated protein futsch-like [Limulus polyphemus]|uniref:Microtubule-associated protein futsch-like n=1 Tax=Limulus polyphemus TaxID=6850 RepID=A0ABM1SSR0_LIMPO|nr:microtubule-associated protein futsch-like [Limulus polyphemus]